MTGPITTADDVATLERVVLPWVSRQRWFPGKGVPVRSSRIRRRLPVGDALTILLVEFDYADRPAELYQVPVTLQSGETGGSPSPEDPAYIGEVPGHGHLLDAARHPASASALLRFLAANGTAGPVTGSAVAPLDDLPARAVTTEQSNTSVIFGDRYIMKTLRQLYPGRNPDLALTLTLNEQHSGHSARTLAWLSVDLHGEEYTLATVQGFLTGARMGWPMVQASLARAVATGAEDDFAAEAALLGTATAQIHAALAAGLGTATLGADGVRDVAATIERRWAALTPRVPGLAAHRDSVDALLDDFRAAGTDLRTQRIHNDLHLTQVMRTEQEWVLIDFEGEPNAPIERRNRLVTPWRDVAGMLRSFDYAAYYVRREVPESPDARRHIDAWLAATRGAYLDGYTAVSGPPSHSDLVAMRLYELEKALFEIDYELTYRPTWLDIPVQGTLHLLGLIAAEA
jgi:maltokinase